MKLLAFFSGEGWTCASLVLPAPIVAMTETTVARHIPGDPEAHFEGRRLSRVAVSRGFVYLGPSYARWT